MHIAVDILATITGPKNSNCNPQPKRVENAKILLANTSMDTDKIKIYGSRVRVDSLNKVAEIEEAEKVMCALCLLQSVVHKPLIHNNHSLSQTYTHRIE